MKKKFLVVFLATLLAAIIISGCVKTEISPEKHCEQDSDCLTSCGNPVGHGGCFNKEYVQRFNLTGFINSPIDGTCCGCAMTTGNVECLCQDNKCYGRELK